MASSHKSRPPSFPPTPGVKHAASIINTGIINLNLPLTRVAGRHRCETIFPGVSPVQPTYIWPLPCLPRLTPKSEYPGQPRRSTLPNSYFSVCTLLQLGVFRPRKRYIPGFCGLTSTLPTPWSRLSPRRGPTMPPLVFTEGFTMFAVRAGPYCYL